jgi:hypothetical protein
MIFSAAIGTLIRYPAQQHSWEAVIYIQGSAARGSGAGIPFQEFPQICWTY